MRPPINTLPSAPDVTDSPATLPVVRISDGLCRAELPDHFEIIVTKRDMAMADDATKATAYDEWITMKAELRRRNYEVWESYDERKNTYIATCTKRHNVAGERTAAAACAAKAELNAPTPSAQTAG